MQTGSPTLPREAAATTAPRIEEVLPLSPVQEGMLFHALRAPAAEVYVVQYHLALRGRVDADALRRAWAGVAARHGVLRAGFRWNGDGAARQEVHGEIVLPWEEHDWRELAAAERDERLDALLRAERARGFDPAAPPLMRLALVRSDDDEWRLAWTYHHLLLDGWSAALVLGEVLAAHAALAARQLPALPARRPWADYAAWAAARDTAAAEAFWRAELAGFEAPTPLAVARETGETGHALAAVRLPAMLTATLRSLGRARGLTLGTLVQGAWALLLARHAGADDVVFGATASGRPAALEGAEEMVGLFINTLPVRARVDRAAPAAAWLAALQARTAEAREHEHAPLVDVRRWSEVPPGEPLFESLVVVENYPVEEALAGRWGVEAELVDVVSWTHYPLTLTAVPGARLLLRLKHDRARVTTAAAERMLGQLETLLATLAERPDAPLAEIALLPDGERRRLERWSATPAPDVPAGATVPALIAAQARRTPDAVAVAFHGERATYAALEAAAARIAAALRARGVGPEARVAVCMERGTALPAALLGVWKAGGAWVPVDPAYPDARIALVLEDAGAAAVLATAALAPRLRAMGIDALEADLLARAAASPAADAGEVPAASADQLAYVVYTSGSTGRPKGVAVTHRSLANLAFALRQGVYGGGEMQGRRVAMNGPVTFDTSVKQLVQLCFGAALHPVPDEVRADGPALAAWLRESGVDVLDVTPAQLRMLLESGGGDPLGPARDVLVAGEAVDAALWARLAGDPSRRFHDLYGPTECTVDATAAPIEGARPVIGRPVPGAAAYVLDPWMEPAPVGVPGELYVGGAGVARGYPGRPALTAARFVPDPSGAAPGARLYRTGDRARWTDDGALEYLGRLDDQVKVRGVRVEPGEAAAALRALPAVRDAVVVARPDPAGGARLVAYVVAADGEPAPDALRRALADRLPDALVPSAFVALDALPLTRHGKVDRRALPDPAAAAEDGAAAPRNVAEEVLEAIWADVLGVERVGPLDDFFLLGGHSLLAARLAARVREALGAEVPIAAVFEARTVAGLAARVTGGGAGAGAPLRPVARGRDLPLSFAQARLWFLHQLEPASAAYHMPSAFRLRGALDVDALRRALEALAARHEALRTAFPAVDGVPVQRIAAPAPVPLAVLDLRGLDDEAREAEVRRRADDEAVRPFDLEHGPPLRAALLRTGAREWVILFTLHHIAGDGWTTGVLVRDAAALYDALAAGREPALPPLPVQYADYAVWQRERLSGARLAVEVAWWRERLAGAPPLLEIPTDRPRPRGESPRGARVPVALDGGTADALRAFARAEGITPFMAALAAWQAVLARWSGQDDVCVGTPTAGRTHTAVEGVAGFFANTLVLRGDLSGDPAFRALARRAREATLAAHAHAELPFEKLVDELAVERSLAHTPLFQAMLVVQAGAAEAPALGGVPLEPLPRGAEDAKFDLLLTLAPDPGGRLAATLTWRADLWLAQTMERMAGHFATLLAAAVAEPDRPLSALPLLGPAERRRLLVELNQTPPAPAPAPVLHAGFEARAARTPGRVALVDGEARVTYGELNARANRLAWHLRALGVGPEVRVGVCAGRGTPLVVALLAVLKAGGAYVPLDPAYPRERLATTLEDAGAPLVLAQSWLLPRLPAHAGRTVLLDGDAAEIDARPDHDPPGAPPPQALAYLIYTSGSTGRPKGVAIEHRGAAALVAWARSAFTAAELETVVFSTSVCFDVSVFELFVPLSAGTTVVMAENALAVPELAAARGATLLSTVPSAGAELLRMDAIPASVRVVGLAGEPIPRPLANALAASGARVVNLYGPSEYTTFTTCAEVRAEAGPVSIGRPLARTRVYLVDRRGALVPQGAPGEALVGGVGLSRGYLGRPALTAERYVPDPFGGEPGARLYRTGDLARWRPDGELDFLGRIDFQVKVRGFRIELGEVEAGLLRHPGVREAAAAVRDEGDGTGKRLVAYVAPHDPGAAPSAAELRAWLGERLPPFMLPHAFVSLAALPHTPSGKVDRRALPAPPDEAPMGAGGAPETPAEQALAAAWAAVLGRPVGVHENFFEAGGDSILSIQVVARARAAGWTIRPRDLFEHPSLAALARVAVPAAAPSPARESDVPAGDLPLTPVQHWFFAQEIPARAHWNQSVLLAPRRALDPARLARAFAALLAHHDALRLRFTRGDDGAWTQRHAAAEDAVVLDYADLSAVADPELAAAVEAEAARLQTALDLGQGPLLRAAYLELGADRGARLAVAVHHLAVDGVSWRVLAEDLQTAFEQAERGETVHLPPKTTAFGRWAGRLAAHTAAGGFDGELALWTDPARGAVPPLPVDRAGTTGREADARTLTLELDQAETEALLRGLPAGWRAGVDEALLAAVARAFAGWTGDGRLLVDVEGHGREELFGDVELSRTAGWFTTLAPVRLDVGGAADVAAALRLVKEQVRALPRRGIGHGALRWLHPDAGVRARLAAMPRPAVRFEYLGVLDASVAEGSLWSAAPEGRGPERDPAAARSHAFVVGGEVLGGRLRVRWTYDGAAYRAETAEALVAAFARELRELASRCAAGEAGGCTPSDFPLAGLTQDALDRLPGDAREVEDVLPPTPAQEGLLFHALYQPGEGAYVVQLAVELEGALDGDALERAWQGAVDRSQALRTAFAWEGADRPLQVVRRRAAVPFARHDWRALDAAAAERRFAAFVDDDRRRGFDPAVAPLTRLALFRLRDDAWRLLWTHHHLVLDGWSLPLVFRDVAALYAAFAAGEPVRLPAPRPLRDYLAWLAGRDRAAAEAFWRAELAGAAPTVLPLRAGEPEDGPAVEATVALEAGETTALEAFARRHGLTVATLVQGAWALLLARYAGVEDVVFGTTLSGRPAELEGAAERVGVFVNVLPARVAVPRGAALVPWLAGVQAAQARLREVEWTPLADVQRWSGLAAGEALFDHVFVFENYPVAGAPAALAGGVRVRAGWSAARNAYALTVAGIPGPRLALRVRHDAARVCPAAAARVPRHLRALLRAMAAHPDASLDSLPLLDDQERAWLLAAGAGPAVEVPDACVHELFEAQAARTPGAPAVRCQGHQLTYAELDARAGRVARALRARGVGPERRVAIVVERSLETAVCALGVLKSGGAYVGVDPATPPERIAFVLADAEVSAILTRPQLRPVLPETGVPVLEVDARAADAGMPADDPGPAEEGPRARPENLAYAIYTSGSTGTPKGVLVQHRSAVAHLRGWIRDVLGREPLRIPLVHRLTFDGHVRYLFMPLLRGETAVVASDDEVQDPAALLALLAAPGRTGFGYVPSLWAAVLDVLERGEAPRPAELAVVLLGGEDVPPPLAARTRALFPGAELWNCYGPTEATATASVGRLPRPDRITIGRAVGNARLYVLDALGHPAPVGIPGELCVGGDGVARGYLGRPALTAERFVPDAFSPVPGARVYRTGDRARWTEDGELVWVGRIDHQVKVRGFRIEPGEVEAALHRHPAVRDAVVVAREDAPGERRLVAYVAPLPGAACDAAALREVARAHLPEYMVPAAFVVLDALPLTANGKVDRRALPAPEAAAAPGGEDGHAPPRTPAEEALAAVWAEVLRVPRVGVHDDFFALGGDSILSIQIVSRARRAGFALSPRDLFEKPTVAALAAAAVAAAPAPVAVAAARSGGDVPLLPAQHRFFAREVPARHHWNHALLLAPRERLEPAALAAALADVAAHHDALRLRFRQEPGRGWRQRPSGHAEVPLDRVDLAALRPDDVADAVTAAAAAVQTRLDLARGPLFRAALLELPGGARRLLLVCHHLVVDGVAWRVILEDLEAAYRARARGRAPALPPATAPVAEWAGRLAAHAASDAARAELAWWTAAVPSGLPPLPVDRTGGGNTAGQARTVTVALGEEETRALLQEVPAAYRTRIDDALLAALARAFQGWTGQPRLLVELEGHGREELFPGLDLSRTVGWFTAPHPVLLDLRGADGPGGALRAVKERLRAIPRRGAGFGVLRWLSPDPAVRAALAALPAPEVFFNYLGRFDGSFSGGAFFALAPEPAGAEVDPRGVRPALLNVNAAVTGGRLSVSWTYGSAVHRAETVERLAARYLDELRAIVAHCRTPGAGGYTPSDFPLAGLGQEALDRVLGSARGVEDVYPLTPTQEGMLFHTLNAPGRGEYITQSSFDLEGPLDRAAFERAWQTTLDRHPALRTAFAWEGLDRPVQVVRREVAFPVAWEDWRGMDPAAREARFAAWLRDDRQRGFDPARAPLMRLVMFRTGGQAHRMTWTHHHLLLDGWSLSRIFLDLVGLYDAAVAGRTARLPAPRPFRDYVAWLQGRDPARSEGAWRAALEGFTEPTPLGWDHPAPAGDGEHERAVFPLAADEAAALQAAARRHGITANTLAQGAWALLLARTGGVPDVVFGATVAGRPAEVPGVEEIVGLFINTLPVRARVDDGAPVLDWLRALQAAQVALREHEHTPLATVQRWSRVPAGTPLFESLLVFENYPVEEELQRRDAAPRVTLLGTLERTNYPLTVVVALGAKPHVQVLFAPDRFTPPAIGRMAACYRRLLGVLAAAPDRRLGAIELLEGGEREAVLAAGHDRRGYPARCIHHLFAEQAARTPGRAALRFEERETTYAELATRARRLAGRLRREGVGPEVTVGVCLPRTPELIVTLLAVLEAGGAYVPLDPAYPDERFAMMLEDARAALVVSTGGLARRFGAGTRVLALDARADAGAAEPALPPGPGAGPGNLAYVLFTSGSTGRPKGVEIEHRSASAILHFLRELVSDDERAAALGSTSITFDVSVAEIFGTLCWGGTLTLVENALALAGPAGRGIRYASMVPTAAAELLRAGAIPATVETLGLGGEALPAELARGLHAPGTVRRVLNFYGPTEDTTYSTWAQVPPEVRRVTVGRPVPDTRAYLLDPGGRPVPPGVVGDLHLGGAGTARGYRGRPALTAERFLPDPFAGVPGARMYRTGDRIRWRDDGELDYLGRGDHQVKVRGFRIETGEVEAALRAHPAVRQAAVVVRDDGPARRLVAYVAADGDAPPSAAELGAWLRRALPEYMVPAAFVALAALPQTPNGKVDRRALPAPEAVGGPEHVAPRTPAEAVLAAVWAEALGVERVGVDDGFFELGGDSILAFQVVSRAAREGVHLTIRQLFEHPTLAELARAASDAAAAAADAGPAEGAAPLTPAQHWFFAQEIVARDHWNQALLLRPRAPLEAGALQAALDAVLAHHDALRLRFWPGDDGGWTQAFAPAGGAVPLALHDLSPLAAEERAAALEAAAARVQASLSLADGPLFRAAWFGPGGAGERLLLVAHHLVVDGVSWRVLLEDLAAAYQAAARGDEVRLPPRTTSFQAWARRLEAHAASPALAAEAAYWTAALPPSLPSLPVDFAGGRNTVDTADAVERALDEEETRALLHEVPAAYRTRIDDALLCAVARAFAGWTGEPRLRVELEAHGREPLFDDVDLARTVGWFTAFHPVLLDLGGAADEGEALVAVKETLRAVPRHGIGHGLLRWMSPDAAVRAALAALPAPEVSFNYLGQTDAVVSETAFFARADEGAGPAVHPRGSRRAHLLEVGAVVEGGRLRCRWSFSRALHRRATVERLADAFVAALRALVEHCRAGAGHATPSDFALAGIDAGTLAMLEADLLLDDPPGS